METSPFEESETEILFEEVDLFATALIQGNCTNYDFLPEDLPAPESAEELSAAE
ncbi:hypothetical protein [Streptomyces mayteni]